MREKRQQFCSLLATLAELCGRQLNTDLLAIYDQALAPLGYDRLVSALNWIIENRSERDPFPAIRTIRERIEPMPDRDSEAVEASNRIVQALGKFGGVNADLNAPAAKAFIGELGWYVVQREGGWATLCERVRDPELPHYKAQWRELAKSAYTRGAQGRVDEPPRLPTGPSGLTRLSGIIAANILPFPKAGGS